MRVDGELQRIGRVAVLDAVRFGLLRVVQYVCEREKVDVVLGRGGDHWRVPDTGRIRHGVRAGAHEGSQREEVGFAPRGGPGHDNDVHGARALADGHECLRSEGVLFEHGHGVAQHVWRGGGG